MIKSQDRSGWFGASDIGYIVGNWETKSFERWWLVKLGLSKSNFATLAMMAGTHYEHKILDSLGLDLQKDKQVKIRRYGLRVNLDGNTQNSIYEVKTYKRENGFKLTRNYVWQVCVQMFATGLRRAYIVAYGLDEEDYYNYYNPIDPARLSYHKIEYDAQFIDTEFLPRVKYLKKCLRKGVWPSEVDYQKTAISA